MTISTMKAKSLLSGSFYYFTDGQWRYYASGHKARGNPISAERTLIAAS
jgi:nitrate reductase alpha subunit